MAIEGENRQPIESGFMLRELMDRIPLAEEREDPIGYQKHQILTIAYDLQHVGHAGFYTEFGNPCILMNTVQVDPTADPLARFWQITESYLRLTNPRDTAKLCLRLGALYTQKIGSGEIVGFELPLNEPMYTLREPVFVDYSRLDQSVFAILERPIHLVTTDVYGAVLTTDESPTQPAHDALPESMLTHGWDWMDGILDERHATKQLDPIDDDETAQVKTIHRDTSDEETQKYDPAAALRDFEEWVREEDDDYND